MRTLKFKSQLTNAFFVIVNQMFGGSSQLPTTAERVVIKSLCTVQTTKQCSAVVVSWEEPPNIWLTAAKNAFVGRPSNVRVRMLLKSAVTGVGGKRRFFMWFYLRFANSSTWPWKLLFGSNDELNILDNELKNRVRIIIWDNKFEEGVTLNSDLK